MKRIISFLRQYIISLNKTIFILTTLLVAILISINYSTGIEQRLSVRESFTERFVGFFLLYSFIFCSAYFIHFLITRHYFPPDKQFTWLLILSPAIFAFKIGSQHISAPLTSSLPMPWNKAWQLLSDWPLKAFIILLLIIIIWHLLKYKKPVAGMTIRNFSAKPYLLLLLLMLPLIIFAATQPDFLHTYPKLKNISFLEKYTTANWKYIFLYELSYGTDFFGIELFFRGLVVLAFARYVGKDAILPMAAFYCCIHFGKPLFECIFSYFGGIILGVIVYRTGSIWGGLITHVGIAWLMEAAGYWGARISDS